MKLRPLTIFPILLLTACGGERTTAGNPSAASSPTVTSAASSDTEMARAGLVYQLPSAWRRVPPESSMRLDQAKIPGAAGEADLAVFFFGPQGGGGVEDNLQRWASQMDGGEPTRDSFSSGDLRISMIDITGTLMPSTMGTGPATPQPGSRLLGAVIEGEGGPWFFKLTGPETTVSEQRDAFVTMLRQARTAAGA